MSSGPTNLEIAQMLGHTALLLEAMEAAPYRVRAYQKAAASVTRVEHPISERFLEGVPPNLEQIPNVGPALAGVIEEFVRAGESSQLKRLKSRIKPESAIARVPGIGSGLAARAVEQLGLGTLDEVALAAENGRLSQIDGFGKSRIKAIRTAVAELLDPASSSMGWQPESTTAAKPNRPDVDLILDIDREYRSRASAGKLRRIAPKRFNPDNQAWLPIMHSNHVGWRFTALFSNTKRAHDLGLTQDWVVVYYTRDGQKGQCTVVSETRGGLTGRRVVRGRESECREFYSSSHTSEDDSS